MEHLGVYVLIKHNEWNVSISTLVSHFFIDLFIYLHLHYSLYVCIYLYFIIIQTKWLGGK